jgi:hypothetical protein
MGLEADLTACQQGRVPTVSGEVVRRTTLDDVVGPAMAGA